MVEKQEQNKEVIQHSTGKHVKNYEETKQKNDRNKQNL